MFFGQRSAFVGFSGELPFPARVGWFTSISSVSRSIESRRATKRRWKQPTILTCRTPARRDADTLCPTRCRGRDLRIVIMEIGFPPASLPPTATRAFLFSVKPSFYLDRLRRNSFVDLFPFVQHAPSILHEGDLPLRRPHVDGVGRRSDLLSLLFMSQSGFAWIAPSDLPPYNVPSRKVRIWDVERGPYGQETVYS